LKNDKEILLACLKTPVSSLIIDKKQIKEFIIWSKEQNYPDFVTVYNSTGESSFTYSWKILEVKPISIIPVISKNIPDHSGNLSEHLKYLPQNVNRPEFYGNPCLLCDKFDYYPTLLESNQESR